MVGDKQLTIYLKKAREAGDVYRERAFDAEIKRRARLRNARSAIRADAMDLAKLLFTIHQSHADKLPAELVAEIKGYLVKHGFITDLPS